MTVVQDAAAVDKFTSALYSVAEAARYLGMSQSTFRNWARGYHADRQGHRTGGRPVITAVGEPGHRRASIPFVGLAEGYALNAIRKAGVPLQRIRPALEQLNAEMGIGHALASRHLYTDGAELLYDYAQKTPGESAEAVMDLIVVRDGQRVFPEVVSDYLRRITFGSDGYALVVPLTGFARANVVADVRRAFGQPTFVRGGARLEDALAMFEGGEDLATVAEEYGIPYVELEDVLRTLARR